MGTGYTDQATAFYQEIQTQLDDFDPVRFRNFYLTYVSDSGNAAAGATQFGVDYLSASYTDTIPTCELTVGIFGNPDDELLTEKGEFTELAAEAVARVRRFRKRMILTRFSGQIPSLERMYPIVSVSVTLYAGRRSLGAERFQAFRRKVATRVKMTLDQTTRYRLEVRSFDTIVDRAMLVALKPIPFLNQELLRKILVETDNAGVLGAALDQLDRKVENAPLFDRLLQNQAVLEHAVPGARDITALEEAADRLMKAQAEWNATFVRTRLAILKDDKEAIEATASAPTYFDSVHLAIEALDNEAALLRVRERIHGKEPRDVQSRLIIDAKLAALDGDAAAVEKVIEKSTALHEDRLRAALYRIKGKLDAALRAAPEVFISYKHESEEHKQWVRRLAEDLRGSGIQALLDEWELEPGGSVGDFAAAGIWRARAMLFVITPASVAAVEADERMRSAVRFEFQIANARRYKDGNFRIVGILRSGERAPHHLADTLYLDFRNDEYYGDRLGQLVRGLTGVQDRPEVTFRKAATPGRDL